MIRGKLVSMRPLDRGDLPEVLEINDDPVVRANVVGWAMPNSLASQESWFEGSHHGNTHRFVVLDGDARLIGVTGLWDVDMHNRNALTALKLGGRHSVRGRGFGTDAIKAMMAFAFYDVGLERLYSSILSDNVASMTAYCDKCNWLKEGTSRQHVWRRGSLVDLHQVGVLKADFDRLPDASDYVDLVLGGGSA